MQQFIPATWLGPNVSLVSDVPTITVAAGDAQAIYIRPSTYGTVNPNGGSQDAPPIRAFTMSIQDPATAAQLDRQNTVLCFGYNTDGGGFPLVEDDIALADRWEVYYQPVEHQRWLERHVGQLSIDALTIYRPFNLIHIVHPETGAFISNGIDLAATTININNPVRHRA